ncbi:unnamed protein product [Mucor circinelloides]|uniref:Late embryogenesis abundant protein LEA-2 subgroup domain-containing protein n=1 Tax=Mucor circinelloides f. circinelloides (strain 1006PhL) TaxID=1220926 RepID=S2JU16_MUCC1|nr:hypothetical protein HMPREF1544_06935 [Mucor circinelloides 1006PhL]
MSYSPPSDPFHHSNHNRQSSLPTVYEDNDPYRVVKKSPRLGSISDNSEFDAVHSRTASDSSTSRLYNGAMALPSSNDYEDPYAKCNYKKWRASTISNHNNINNDRANSYLPYSHHQRDPNQKTEPIYIEEYTAPASTTLGMGSMLQDSMTDQINMRPSQQPQIPDYNDKMSTLPQMKKRKQKKRCCGLRYRTIAFISLLSIAIIVVIWYFVWPRIPEMRLDDVDNIGSIQVVTNTTKKSMSTSWLLNMTADNSANWVPTHISSIDVSITDDKTMQTFGNGTSPSMVLAPRTSSIVCIEVDIYYASDSANDTTFQDLYNACGVQVTSNMPFENQQDVLNITLHLTYHIAGIVWPYQRQVPFTGLVCPTS